MVGLERPQGQPRIFTHPANTNPPSMFDPDITVESDDVEQEVQMEDGDRCCSDAKDKLCQWWAEKNNMSPSQHQRLRTNLDATPCDIFREMIETIPGTGPGTDMAEHQRTLDKYRQIADEWDACASESFGGMFTASADALEEGWDAIQKNKPINPLNAGAQRLVENYQPNEFLAQYTGEMPVEADMGGDACCIDAKNKWIEGLREIFGDDYSAPHHADEIFQEVAPFHQVKVVAASAHPLSSNDEIYRSYEEMSCEEFRDAIEQFAGGRPGPYYNANVGNRRNPTPEHHLAKRILEEWDMCEAKSTFGDNMDIYASADTPFLAVWDAIIKKAVRGSDEKPEGRFFIDDFPRQDPEAYPMNDLRIRRPTDDGSGDYLGYYTHGNKRAYTFLEPFAQGSGWRPLPTDVKFESAPFEEDAPDPWLRDERGNRVPALSPQRDRVLGMDILDTAMHEAGHQATFQEIEDAIDEAKLNTSRNTTWSQESSGRDGWTEDSLYPIRLRNQQVEDRKRQLEALGEVIGRNDLWAYDYESLAGLLLDNPEAMKEWLKGTEEMNALSQSAFNHPEMDLRSSGHEKAAYAVEYPNHPGYVAGKWLMHSDVPQAAKRKYLQAVERAQKKAGVQEPIEGKALASQISPNLGWGKRTRNLRQIMGNPPENRDAPESKRLLMPAKERIQQNMINAAIGQAYAILARAGDFRMDPVAGRVEQHAERVKQATNYAKPLINAIKRYFKTNDGQGQTLQDLPEDVRMELGRMELRQHLANMVAQQFELEPDRENNPTAVWDSDRLDNLVAERMGGEFPPRPGWDFEGTEEEKAQAEATYRDFWDRYKAEQVKMIGELMNSGPFEVWGEEQSPFPETRYDYSDYARDNAIEIPYGWQDAYQKWLVENDIPYHHWGGDTHVKLKGPVKRTTPMKRVPKPKYEYDPVTRAIADAFMMSEYDVIGDGQYRSSSKPHIKGRSLRPNFQGKKWGGELFSGEVGPMRGGLSQYGRLHMNDTTDSQISSLKEFMDNNKKRINLNQLLDYSVQRRLNEIASQKHERGEA